MDTSWERAIAQVQARGTGTGVVIARDERLLLTCAHVVGDETQVHIRFPDHDAVLPADVIENWSPDLDAALLQAKEPLPAGVAQAPLGLRVIADRRFHSRGFRQAEQFLAGLHTRGEIRGLTDYPQGYPAIQLWSNEIDDGMSGAPVVDAESGLVVGLIAAHWETTRHADGWLAFAIPLFAIADHWPRLRALTAEARYRDLLQTAYGFWERRFTPLDMTAQEREQVPETRRGWIPPCFSALEEQKIGDEQPDEPPLYRHVPLDGGLPEALQRYGSVVLLGEPGAGKTTALAHLAGQLAADPDRIPILVPLRRYERDEDPLNFIRRTWSLMLQDDLHKAIEAGEAESLPLHEVDGAIALLASLLAHWLEQGRLVLLLDGLNEMPRVISSDPRLSRMSAFVERARLRGNRLIVACRVLDYVALRHPLARPLQQVTLEPLDDEQIHSFLRGYLDIGKVNKLNHWLEQQQRSAIRELCRVPFFLMLVVYLYEKEGVPPTRRVDLLDSYVNVAIRREQERLGESWPSAQLIEPLSDLALTFQEQDVLELWENEVRQRLTSFPEGGAGAALRMAEGVGLLRVALTADPRGARLSFSHQLWQQDLAARALVRRSGGIV